jgi:DNA polymerase-4
MPLEEALRLCPNLYIIPPHMELYQSYSSLFFEFLYTVTPLVEPGSIDEGYLDVTERCETENALELAERIQQDIWNQLHLPVSIGIGPNKFLAKMASDMKKPMGITVLRKREIAEKMWPLPISAMFGVGKKTFPLLEMIGIKTIGDLANYQDMKMLEETVGPTNAKALYAHAHGEGSKEIDLNSHQEVSSVSNSQTFDHDEYLIPNMKMTLKILANSVANRLEKRNLKAYTFTVQIRYYDFKTVSKTRTLDNPTNNDHEINRVISALFDSLYDGETPVRLLGVGSSKLIKAQEEVRQLSIFDDCDEEEKHHSVNKLVASLQESFGENVINKGLTHSKKPKIPDK